MSIFGIFRLKSALVENTKALQKCSDIINELKRDNNLLLRENAELKAKITASYENEINPENIKKIIDSNSSIIFLSGDAGVGKTYLLKRIAKISPNSAVIAPTGVAAYTAGGTTIHRFFHLPPCLWSESQIKKSATENFSKLSKLEYLFIDEISMVSAYTFDCLDTLLKQVKNNKLPFGGIKVVVAGDLFQLPPVINDDYREKIKTPRCIEPSKHLYEFFFQSDVIKQSGIKILWLTKQHRADKYFNTILNNIRHEYNVRFVLKEFEVSEIAPKNALHIVHTNKEAEKINLFEMKKIKHPTFTYKAYRVSKNGQKTFCAKDDEIFKDAPLEWLVELKLNAIVIVTMNISPTITNGTMGRIVKITQDSVVIERIDNQEQICIGPEHWDIWDYKIENEKLVPFITDTIYNIPLKIAFALTVHKTQGKTLAKVYYDNTSTPFASGQTYVALSRTRRINDIVLATNPRETDIFFEQEIKDFIKSKDILNL